TNKTVDNSANLEIVPGFDSSTIHAPSMRMIRDPINAGKVICQKVEPARVLLLSAMVTIL
ncbi:MAG: hypothetical protein MUP11_13805, partial [Anaerolineales bacterium]|nr:hypothetical protein [Anaerolineales bacterium]